MISYAKQLLSYESYYYFRAVATGVVGSGRSKRSVPSYDSLVMGSKRAGAKGFHEGIFDQGFGGFTPLKKRSPSSAVEKRRPEMTSRGIHGDAFTSKTASSDRQAAAWLAPWLYCCNYYLTGRGENGLSYEISKQHTK